MTKVEARGRDKFAERRRMLARSALAVIAENGFAKTGLRDIAEHSELSHGSLHYYFADKDDLIAESVWLFKSECAHRYDDIISTAQSASELAERVAEVMAATLRDEAPMHRLWYDLRNQALFGAGFNDTIVRIDDLLEERIWAIVSRYAELTGRPSKLERSTTYALIDGLFRHALISLVRGDETAVDRLRAECAGLITTSA